MSFIDTILAETTTTGDVAPVLTGGAPEQRLRFRRKLPKRTKKTSSPFINKILGEEEEMKNLIPSSATELSIDGKKDEPGKTVNDTPSEPLMTPDVALVAPDVTPGAMVEIDPSSVPMSATPAPLPVNEPQTDPSQSTVIARTVLPQESQITPQHAVALSKQLFQLEEDLSTAEVGGVPNSTSLPEGAMPDHTPSDGQSTLAAARRFMG